MLTHISHVGLFVHNQDEAKEFYLKLGFFVHTDAEFDCPLNGKMRWLTLNLPEQKHVELVIALANTPEEKALVGRQSANKPLFTLTSADCRKDYEDLSKQGTVFVHEPKEEPWGLCMMFKDLYGNLIYVCQPKRIN